MRSVRSQLKIPVKISVLCNEADVCSSISCQMASRLPANWVHHEDAAADEDREKPETAALGAVQCALKVMLGQAQ